MTQPEYPVVPESVYERYDDMRRVALVLATQIRHSPSRHVIVESLERLAKAYPADPCYPEAINMIVWTNVEEVAEIASLRERLADAEAELELKRHQLGFARATQEEEEAGLEEVEL